MTATQMKKAAPRNADALVPHPNVREDIQRILRRAGEIREESDAARADLEKARKKLPPDKE